MIDEAGNTSQNGTNYFVMAAVIVQRSRHLLETSKLLRDKKKEKKFHNALREERIAILESISNSKTKIIFDAIDKKAFSTKHRKGLDNYLYQYAFTDLLRNISDIYGSYDAKIMMDRTRQLSTKEIEIIINSFPMNIVSCKKIDSASNRCIQIADFVAGSIFAKFEHNNDEYYKLIEGRILIK